MDEDQKTLETVIDAVTEKTVEQLKKELPLRKDIFGSSDDEAKKELQGKREAAAEYLRKLANGESTKGLTAGTSTAGSELVPTYVSDQLITVAQNYGLVRKYGRSWPMEGSNVDIPTLSSISAYRIDTDGSKITSAQPTTGAVNLRGKTVGVIIPVSQKLLRNATPALVDALNMLAGKAIAKLEDDWAFNGKGAGEGIFQNTSVPVLTLGSTNTTYNKVVAEDLLSVMDLMDENFVDENCRWLMSLSVLNNFRRLRSVVGSDKQGFLFEGFGGQLPATMWDIPYSTSAVMPKNADGSQAGKKFIALANFENLIHGDSKQYTMEISNQATITDVDGTTLINLFEQNMVALKVYGEIDIQLANPSKAFSVIKTAAS